MPEKGSKTGRGLERQVADAYRALGARKVEHDVDLAGNQIDVYVEMESADRSLHRIAVEVKDWDRPVGIDVLNDFVRIIDVLRNQAGLIDEGVIVSASGFTRQARKAAEPHRIRLLEPPDLAVKLKPPDPAVKLKPSDPAGKPPVPVIGITIQQRSKDDEPSPVVAILEVTVNIAFPAFSAEQQNALISWLASRAHISPDEIRVRGVVAGSTKLILEVPIEAAERLVHLYRRGPSAETATPERYTTPIGSVTGPVHTGAGDIVIYAGTQPSSTPAPTPPTGTGPIELEFANREVELQRLKAPIENPGAPRYVQVYAPCGLGKTYLLNKCRGEYEKAGWLCAGLDFSADENLRRQSTLILEQLGRQFEARAGGTRTCADLAQRVVRARRQSAIFLDAVDLASGEVRRWIKMHLIPALEERIPDPTLRPYVIAAGRHPVREWAVYSRQRFDGFPLTPFTDRVVDDLLRRLAQEDGYPLPDSFFQQTTEAVLFITKGHPAAIKRVLQKIRDSSFTMPAREIMQRDTFNQTVGALLDEEILALHVPERLRGTFKTLCVLRGYTPNLLERLGWLPAQEHINWDLVSELSKTHLVEMPDSSPLYRLESLIRQMVTLQMEYNDRVRFLELNRAAISVFEEQVEGQYQSGSDLPDKPVDRMQVALILEALYHHAILLRLDRADQGRARNELQGKAKKYLACRRTRENDKYWVDLLVGTVEKDTELTALIYELTGDGGLEFVLRPLFALVGNEEG